MVESFRKNNITIICLIHIDLKNNIWPLRQVNNTIVWTSNLAYIR